MRVLAGSLFLLFAYAVAASAQIPNGNVFVGYSYVNADMPGISSRQNLNGWEASLEGKVLPFLSIVADGGGNYGRTQIPVCPVPTGGISCGAVNGTLYTGLFGPRVSASFHGVRPFAHVLFGGAFLSGALGNASFASAFGAGVDVKLAPIIGWRIQGDYIHTHFSDSGEGHARFSTGIVFRF